MPAARFQVRSIAPAMVAIALLIGACGAPAATVAPTEATMPTSAASATPTATASLEPVATPTSAPPVTLPPATAPPITQPPVTAPPPSMAPAIGVSLLIGDQQSMTVLAAEQWAGTSQVKPRSGKVFYTVSIKVDAIKLTSFDSADFKLKDAAGKSYAWRPGRAPHLYSLDNMTPGGTYTGWITYEIPKASLVGLTLIYAPHFLAGATFKIPVS